MLAPGPRPLRILHAVRAPSGGAFRHVLDLAEGQAALGHEVGILTDSRTASDHANGVLNDIASQMKLGVHRLAMHREPHPTDPITGLNFLKLAQSLNLDVLHGHGAKTGAFARLKSRAAKPIRVYTPHGGSLHYKPGTLKGAFYTRLERALMNRTDLFLFESSFAKDTFERTIGAPDGVVRCVFNGVGAPEFDPVVTADSATDLVYVGELRHIKGADLLLEAVARLRANGRQVTLTLGGDGDEAANIKAQVTRLRLEDAVHLLGFVKARDAFSKGRLLVVPSRGDSMPYVVIEAGAAGIPMIASNVGGIPEIFGPFGDGLFAANNVDALAGAIEAALANFEKAQQRAKELRERIFQNFSQSAMVNGILNAYQDTINHR